MIKRLLILLVPFTILSLWVQTAVSSIYRDIFINQSFIQKMSGVEWYHLVASLFATGIPLWLITVYYFIRKWKAILSFTEVFYIFMCYISFFYMLLTHIYPPFWITMLIVHILFLILMIRKIPQSARSPNEA